MNVERIETAGRFAELREEWNNLLERSASDCVFLTHEWLHTWWKHLADGRRLSILACREDGNLVGIMPVAVRDAQYTRMMPRALEFLGSGVIGSDYLDAIMLPGHEREVMRAFGDQLNQSNLMLHLSQLKRGSSAALELAEQLQRRRWTVAETKINVCPFISLAGLDWDGYLATRSSSQRYNFNRRLRQLMKGSEMRLECVQSPGEAQTGLDVLIALHRKRWGARGSSEAFQTDAVVAFHREFVERAAGRGWLRLMILRLGNQPVAALYGLRYGERFYFYQSGFDPAYSKQSVGLVVMGLAIKAAIEEGVSEYDFLHGDEEYKFHWASGVRDLGRLELYPPHARGRIYKRAIDLNRAARQMAKRVLTKG
ncbi:MAG TPA: GNAT family N-acetyltransferase [Terriglobia bacterium]|nr:GNAT family N-acetyltransferase [Terriglobia bacterium]